MWVDGIYNMDAMSAINHRRAPLKFSIKEDFATQIDKVLNDNGDFEQTHLYMGETPKVLTDLGLRKLPMLITAKHIYTMAKDSGKYKKVNYHDLGAELIKQLPKAIAEPIGIMESATKDDSIVVLTELIDKESRPVIIAIKFNGYGNYNDVEIESNVVTSGYGKDNITSFIKKNFGKNRILYWNNKKARTINTPELQLLNNIDNSSFADNISRFKGQVNEISNEENKKFSLKEPVEVGDKLIAMHNITPDKLWKALKLGGFPMPSLAVTKAKIGHTNFGDVSLLFDKSTIDPETDSRNKVYGADAWTPVFPQIDYKLNEKKADEVYDRANKAGDLAFFNPVSLASTNLESKVKDVNGDSLVEHFKNDYGLKNMYLAEKGEPVKMLFEEKDRGGDIGKWFAENCKNEVLEYNKIENNPEDETQYVLDNKEKLSEVYANYLRKVKKENEEYITKRINRRPMLLIGVKNGLMSGMDSLEGKKDIVEDIEATEKLIDDKVNQADYEKWIKDLFAGIVEKEGVHNGKDPYTASGNRRSFEKLHYDVTLDNIVQAMIGQADNVRNDSAFFNGLKTIRAVATEDFGSLEDIRNGKNKLRTIDDDNYELLYNNLSDELADIISKIASKTYGSSNDFIKQDAIGMNIADAILAGNTTAEGLKKYLNKYGSKVTVEDTKLLENLIREVANMPVNMFEAKLERSVRFDEVVGAVVPADIDKDLISALEEEGVEVSKYESDEDRIDTVNRLADKKNIMFSIKDSMTEKDYYHYGWAIVNKILDKEETASFLKQIGDLKRGNYYVRNYEGLIIIPVYNKMGISNKLVYTDGRYQNPSIEKILNISYKQ